MSDNDYIRKAVELADGWKFPATPEPTYCAPDFNSMVHGHFTDYIAEMPEWHKDALAAQLVRQVDALPDHDIFIEPTCSKIGKSVRPGSETILFGAIIVYGSDRAMNTIKVVVDSRFLLCEHGKRLKDYCQPCGRINGG